MAHARSAALDKCKVTSAERNRYFKLQLKFCCETQVVKKKMSSKTCAVWLYFKEIGTGKVKCELCQKTYSYKYGSASNLKKHLAAKHPTIDLNVGERYMVSKRKSTVSIVSGNHEMLGTIRGDLHNLFI